MIIILSNIKILNIYINVLALFFQDGKSNSISSTLLLSLVGKKVTLICTRIILGNLVQPLRLVNDQKRNTKEKIIFIRMIILLKIKQPFNFWMDEQTMVYKTNRILFRKENKWSDTCNNMNESQIHYAKWREVRFKKQPTVRCYLCVISEMTQL